MCHRHSRKLQKLNDSNVQRNFWTTADKGCVLCGLPLTFDTNIKKTLMFCYMLPAIDTYVALKGLCPPTIPIDISLENSLLLIWVSKFKETGG